VALVTRVTMAFLVSVMAIGGATDAQPRAPTEYAVKAAFLVKFADYVDWPADHHPGTGPIVIAVLGADPFGSLLDEMLAKKEVRGRKVVARRFNTVEDALPHASILFISSSERLDLTRILRALDGRPVLTVGDMDHFASRGGIVGLRVQGKTVRFDINVEEAEKAGLKMSSQLLKLARIVRTGRDA
jgi:uncharacterized protein DUF4154